MAIKSFVSKNPFTQEVYKSFPFTTSQDLDVILKASHSAFLKHRLSSFEDRGEKIRHLGELFKARADSLGMIISKEMGKPISQSRAEVSKCGEHCLYYADNAKELLQPMPYPISGASCQVEFFPLGSIFCVMPFNFPIWTPMKTVIPHLMAGNTVVIKPPENTPDCAIALDEITTEVGLKDELKIAFLSSNLIEEAIANPIVRGVSLTGSVGAGRAIASMAGKYLKKSVMELGGSDPFIVLDDADLGLAIDLLVTSRIRTSGQVCNSPKRIIVHSKVYDEFLQRLIDELSKYAITDPLQEECQLGPLARQDILDNLLRQVEESVSMGAKVAFGGQVTGPCRFQPVVLTDVSMDMPVGKEETFGPVFSMFKVNSQDEAISLVNESSFGLGCVIITQNTEKIKKEVVPLVESGSVFINDITKSFVNIPNGGIKDSGYGRELGFLGIREFTNPKIVFSKS